MRARAFGRVAGVLTHELAGWGRSALLDDLTGVPPLALVA